MTPEASRAGGVWESDMKIGIRNARGEYSGSINVADMREEAYRDPELVKMDLAGLVNAGQEFLAFLEFDSPPCRGKRNPLMEILCVEYSTVEPGNPTVASGDVWQ